jgi:hypothetical protein
VRASTARRFRRLGFMVKGMVEDVNDRRDAAVGAADRRPSPQHGRRHYPVRPEPERGREHHAAYSGDETCVSTAPRPPRLAAPSDSATRVTLPPGVRGDSILGVGEGRV